MRNLEDLNLDERQKIGYTYKALGAGFWALRQADYRNALQKLTMEVTAYILCLQMLSCMTGMKF